MKKDNFVKVNKFIQQKLVEISEKQVPLLENTAVLFLCRTGHSVPPIASLSPPSPQKWVSIFHLE